MTTTRTSVAVIFGGRSSEHEISCVTASGVLASIDRDVYDVTAVGVTTTGEWVLVSSDPADWTMADGALPRVDGTGADRVTVRQGVGAADLLVLDAGDEAGDTVTIARVIPVDVWFPLLHGPYGEDGTVQGLLELSDARYVGAGVLSSAAGMDKHFMKAVLMAAGLPVGPHVVIQPAEWVSDPAACLDAVASLTLPVFVKPARAGSSVGVSRVTDADHLAPAIEAARSHDPKVLVEAAIDGREVECGVMSDPAGGPPQTSLPGEIEVVSGHDFYSYEAKYLDGNSAKLSCPADLSEEVTARVRDIAARTFTAMGCEGLARVDVFVTRDGSVVVNEINTMPGFTPISMFPRMWRASGVDYATQVDQLLRHALTRPVGLR